MRSTEVGGLQGSFAAGTESATDVNEFERLLKDGAQKGNDLKVPWAKDICANDNDADPACWVALAGGAYLLAGVPAALIALSLNILDVHTDLASAAPTGALAAAWLLAAAMAFRAMLTAFPISATSPRTSAIR